MTACQVKTCRIVERKRVEFLVFRPQEARLSFGKPFFTFLSLDLDAFSGSIFFLLRGGVSFLLEQHPSLARRLEPGGHGRSNSDSADSFLSEKLLVAGASLLVTRALLLGTRSY